MEHQLPHILESSRLQLRPFTLEDSTFILELLNTAGWLKYIGDRKVRDVAAAKLYIQNRILKSYEEHDFGLWLVQEKQSLQPTGMCGLIKRDGLEQPDLGFAFLPAYTGKGYAFESAEQVLNYCKTKLGLKQIQAITVADNISSIRLLEKVGMQFQKTVRIPDDNEELLLYALSL